MDILLDVRAGLIEAQKDRFVAAWTVCIPEVDSKNDAGCTRTTHWSLCCYCRSRL